MTSEGPHLTKPTKYNIEDSNIALLGSDLEKRVREHAGDKEPAWNDEVGASPGLQIWRIEKFTVVTWPKDKYGSFYDGDSYIVLHTYKKNPETDALSYDLHFWLGENTSQDEAGTAAYKTVELDDHLHGAPIQYREVQNQESQRFLSYFPRFMALKGGVSSGFHHVTEPPPLDIFKLYRVSLTKVSDRGSSNLIVREVSPEASSLVQGDVYVLDKGAKIWQLNTKESLGKEKFKAAEFTQILNTARQGSSEVLVYDEGASGAGIFLSELGATELQPNPHPQPSYGPSEEQEPPPEPKLYRISDASGQASFEPLGTASASSLSSSDAFIVDNSADPNRPTVYVWIGSSSSVLERRLAIQYAQNYVYGPGSASSVGNGISIVKVAEGNENDEFERLIGNL